MKMQKFKRLQRLSIPDAHKASWRFILILGLLLVITSGMFACSRKGSPLTPTVSEISSDEEKLAALISVPYAPQSVRWQIHQPVSNGERLGPNDWALMAVFKYDERAWQEIETGLENVQPLGDLIVMQNFLSDWLPDSVRDSFDQQDDGEFLILNTSRFPATPFVKSPLLNGYYFLTKDMEIFLYLFTS